MDSGDGTLLITGIHSINRDGRERRFEQSRRGYEFSNCLAKSHDDNDGVDYP